jgi:hypothetical protein
MILMKNFGRLLSGVLFVCAASYAQADIMFSPTQSGGGTVDNVLFNQQPNDQTGNPVFGNINVTGNPLVVLRGNETLITPSGGQARVEALDGGLNFLDVSLAAAGTGFDSAVFNLNSPKAPPELPPSRHSTNSVEVRRSAWRLEMGRTSSP